MELEAKYRALEHIRAKAIETLDWGAYTLGRRETYDLRDTLLDTPDRLLGARRETLRLRHTGTEWLLTLKRAGTVDGAVHRREELEEPVPSDSLAEAPNWPAAIREALDGSIDLTTLQPQFHIRNRRRAWPIIRDGIQVAELALDRGTISAADRRQAMHELEIEVKGQGTPKDLEALMALLNAQLPLAPEALSKSQRGRMLLDQEDILAQLQLASKAVPMQPGADFAEAGRSTLATQLLKLLRALHEVRHSADPEGVHQSRVAVRRLRAIFHVLGEAVYAPDDVRRLRRGLKRLADTLSPVRDAEVLLERLATYLEPLDAAAQAEFAPLLEQLAEQRDTGRTALARRLARSKTRTLLTDLERLVTTTGAGLAEIDSDPVERTRSEVRHWAGSILWTHYELVRAYEPGFEYAPVKTLHALRIAVKHLRYTLELFLPALDKEAASLHEQLVAAQDHLGALQDAEVALELVAPLLAAAPTSPALAAFQQARADEHEHLHQTARTALGPVFGLPFRRRLASLISKL